MNKNKITAVIRLLLFLSLNVYSQAVGTKVQQVSSQEFKRLINEGKGIVLDTRTYAEFENQHISNAKLLDFYAKNFRTELLKLPRNKKLLLYCTSGPRSDYAAQFLVKNGYTQVYNLQRGIVEWIGLKYAVVKGNSSLLKQKNIYSPEQYIEAISNDALVFVDFYAEWCEPCIIMMPMIDSLKIKYDKSIKIIKVNCDLSTALIQRLQIRSVPLFVLYKNGQVIFDKPGKMSRNEIESVFSEHLQ